MSDQLTWQYVCQTSELSHAKCREFRSTNDEMPVDAFVVNWHGEFYAYVNSCPHTRITMNWAPDQFFDPTDTLLLCGLHGALFEPDSGLCIRGPCLGQSLTSLAVNTSDGRLFAEIPAKKA